jgi:hypothetical protein
MRRAPVLLYLKTKDTDFKDKRVQIKKELGMWLYKKESLQAFQRFCSERNVKARGLVKIVSTDAHARCLRTTKVIHPGQAVITAPPHAALNFLVANKDMYAMEHHFPLNLDATNWNMRLKHLNGAATHEMLMAGWIVRLATRKNTPWTPFAEWLLEDTTGRDGIAGGIGRERGDGDPVLDQLLLDMAHDAGEEVQDYTELLFRGYACLMKRASPIDHRVVALQLPGTTIARRKPDELFVPTLIPLVDCIPHDELGNHNVMLDYHSAEQLEDPALRATLGISDKDTSVAVIGKQGLISVRAIEYIDEGNYLSIRGWPKTDEKDNEYSQQTILEQTIARNNAMAA